MKAPLGKLKDWWDDNIKEDYEDISWADTI
jgi:hypothetical protein